MIDDSADVGDVGQEAGVAMSMGAVCCHEVSECTHLVAVLRSEGGYTGVSWVGVQTNTLDSKRGHS